MGVRQPYFAQVGERCGVQVMAKVVLQGADADSGRGGDVPQGDTFTRVFLAVALRSAQCRWTGRGVRLAAGGGVVVRLRVQKGVQQKLLEMVPGQGRGHER